MPRASHSLPGTKSAYVVQSATALTGQVGGHNVINVSNPASPVATDNVRVSSNCPTWYPVTAVPSRKSVAFPATASNMLSVVEMKLNGDTAMQVQSVSVGMASTLAYGASTAPDGRVLVAVPTEHYVAVVNLVAAKSFMVPWEVTKDGPNDIKAVPQNLARSGAPTPGLLDVDATPCVTKAALPPAVRGRRLSCRLRSAARGITARIATCTGTNVPGSRSAGDARGFRAAGRGRRRVEKLFVADGDVLILAMEHLAGDPDRARAPFHGSAGCPGTPWQATPREERRRPARAARGRPLDLYSAPNRGTTPR